MKLYSTIGRGSTPLQGLSLARSALNKVPMNKVIRSEQLDSQITKFNYRLTRSDSFPSKGVGGSFLTPDIWQKVSPPRRKSFFRPVGRKEEQAGFISKIITRKGSGPIRRKKRKFQDQGARRGRGLL